MKMNLGLGSSDAKSLHYLRGALRALKALPDLHVLAVSPVYRSDAMLPPHAPAAWKVEYLNLGVQVEASETRSPLQWMEAFKKIERDLGRRERERWAPREIDIDLLTCEALRIDLPGLTVPHVGLLERPFAAFPLADVDPEWRHPTLAQTAREFARSLGREGPAKDIPFHTRPTLHSLTELVGVLNITPDSFSDGGQLNSAHLILQRAKELADAGATVLDIGAESTRPGASPVSTQEEIQRLRHATDALRPMLEAYPNLGFSLDCRNPGVLREAVHFLPWAWLNDVEGFRHPEMCAIARDTEASLVVMHSLSVPPRAERVFAEGREPVSELLEWGFATIDRLDASGLNRARLILDPGIGFGKTPAQNMRVIAEARRLHALRTPILVGHSRKSFLSEISRLPPAERDLETALLTAELAKQGMEFLRVHNVPVQARALRLNSALQGGSAWSIPNTPSFAQ